jgi:hypothetical protein
MRDLYDEMLDDIEEQEKKKLMKKIYSMMVCIIC